jgi:benzylsuccinate CoA-transferase BbsF subunit
MKNNIGTENQALAGVNVLSFELAQAGPMTTQFLAAFGAKVIRVESQKHLDWHRQSGPFVGEVNGPDRAACYLHANPGKMSFTFNLRHPKAKELLPRLVKWADVVADNFAGGVMKSLGLGYDDLIKIRPDIIVLSSDTYGQTGPFAGIPSYGVPLSALSGLPHLCGYPGELPQFPGFAITDFIAPRVNVLAIISALDFRKRTGKGQFIDCAQFESVVSLMTPALLDLEANKHDGGRIGNHEPGIAPYNIYQCAGDDQWCAICVFNDGEWKAFVQAIGNPAWARKPEFSTMTGRCTNQDEMDRLITEWTSKHTREEVMTILQDAGIAAGIVATGHDLSINPQLAYDGFYHKIDHPGIGEFSYSGIPIKMTRTPYQTRKAAALGEHNEWVATQILGLKDEEFVELMAEGLLE